MELPRVDIKDIPDGYYVIRVKGAGQYIHFNGENIFSLPKMDSCLALRYSMAVSVKNQIQEQYPELEIEVVKIQTAYEQHELIERQIECN
jgi:hypothetical protein